MKLIVGLGNPGKEYEKTRHNLGFRVLDRLAQRLNVAFDRSKFKGEYADGVLPEQWRKKDGDEDGKLLLVKPQTYMNLSGETVVGFAGFYKIPIDGVLVVVDDVALPVGALRIRRGGSDGGHNGLKNTTLRLGSQEYARLRVGVGGRDAQTMQGGQVSRQPADLAGHVLGRFSAEEEETLKKTVELAVEACLCWAGRDVETAMNKYNTREQKPPKPKPEQKPPETKSSS